MSVALNQLPTRGIVGMTSYVPRNCWPSAATIAAVDVSPSSGLIAVRIVAQRRRHRIIRSRVIQMSPILQFEDNVVNNI
jgi:hypothetical protein